MNPFVSPNKLKEREREREIKRKKRKGDKKRRRLNRRKSHLSLFLPRVMREIYVNLLVNYIKEENEKERKRQEK